MKTDLIHEMDDARMSEARISKGGQISVPAAIRHRWATDRVRLVDLGDHLVVRPIGGDPIEDARGSLPLPAGMTSEQLRADARAEDRDAEHHRLG